MDTGCYGLTTVSSRTGRFGMRCIGILMFALVFTFADLGKNPVCHASSMIDIGTICPNINLNCESSATVWVKDIIPSDRIQNVYVSVSYDDKDLGRLSDIIPVSFHHLLLEYPDEPGIYKGRLDCFSKSGTYLVSMYARNLNDEDSETVFTWVTKTCTVVKGDLNNDNKVDLGDAILALRVLSGINPDGLRADYNSAVDVNGDNRIGLEEVIYILQTVAVLR